MNENITNALNSYLTDPDPGYAVAITGKWGCGKTHFIKEWHESLVHPAENDEEDNGEDVDVIVLTPVSVSLYGMRSVSEIVTAIDRELHPIIYSKGVKIAKKILKVAGKVVLRTDLDFDEDGNNDASLSLSLDSLALFRNDDASIQGDKLLIFDDFERSFIDTKELLGFINWFVEKSHCHVIVIGALDKLQDNEKEVFDEFREKTIGKLFELKSDVEGATDCFLNEVPRNDWTIDRKDLILASFNAVESSNLRILRQAIRDFNRVLEETGDFDSESRFLRGFLASFIIVSNLFHNGDYKDLIKRYQNNYISALTGDANLKALISSLQNRCNPVSTMAGYPVLDHNMIRNIVDYLDGKSDIKDYVRFKLDEENKAPSVFEKLALFENLEDKDFEDYCELLEDSLNAGALEMPYEIGRAIDLLCMFDSNGLRKLNPAVIENAEKKMKELFSECQSAENVYEVKIAFLNACNTSRSEHEGKDSLMKAVEIMAVEQLKNVPSSMQRLLLDLNDENVGQLVAKDKELAPDRHSAFELTSIFAEIDPRHIFDALKRMTNKSRNIFNSFLRGHFKLDFAVSNESPDRYKADIPFILDMKKLVEENLEELPPGPARLSYQNLEKTLTEIRERDS